QAAVEIDPTCEGAWLSLGMVQQDQHDVPGAIVTFRTALNHLPESAPIWCNLGTMYLQIQAMEGLAEDAFRKAIGFDSALGVAWLNLGHTFARLGRLDEAEQVLRDATENVLDDSNVWVSLTSVLIEKGDCIGAQDAFSKAQGLVPSDEGMRKVERYLEQRCGRVVRGPSMKMPRKKEVPKELMDLMNKGASLFQQGRLAESEQCYREVIAIDEEFADAWGMLGANLSSQGRKSEALEPLERSLKLDASSGATWLNYGTALKHLGRFEEAEKALTRATEILPEMVMAWYNLGNLYLETGQLKNAEDMYRRAIEMRPNEPNIWHNLGLAIAKQRRYDEAEDALRAALKLDPGNTAVWALLADVLAELGKVEAADEARSRSERSS
ncbi:MAG: tetratricopeptide repeat protein, partial [Promethearchaeota archaeon]